MTRKERIEKMLHELHYEIEVGMLQGDIEECLNFEWIVPISKTIRHGVVVCRLSTRPMHMQTAYDVGLEPPRLKVVK